ncbi:MAG: cytochrome c [Planctomycetota bacterium]
MRVGERRRWVAATVAVVALVALGADSPRRAKPPTFGPAEEAVFTADARKLLVGPRPDFASQQPKAVAGSQFGSETPAGDGGSFEWSALIGEETIETEIKRQAKRVSGLVTSSTAFKGGGYQECRDAFSMLAVMFAIADEHDGDPRWRDRAAGLSALFARAGANCKVGTDGSYREAKARSDDLADLVRGGRPDAPKPPADRNWGDVADRSPLMRRMEQAHAERLPELLSSERSFGRGSDDALHESQVLAALGEVIIREGLEDADDEEYAAFARSLRDASKELSQAAETENYNLGRPAMGRATKTCSDCHDLYRG